MGRVAVTSRRSILSQEEWALRHRLILAILWLHLPVVLAYGALRIGVEQASLGVLIAVLAAGIATLFRGRRRIASVSATLGLFTCSALLLDFSSGLLPMHFHFFVMLMVIVAYQDSLSILVSVGYVLIHHSVLVLASQSDAFTHPVLSRPVIWAVTVGGFVQAAAGAAFMTWRSERVARRNEEAFQTDLLEAERRHEQLEAQLIQSQKMDAVGRLAGGVAHDFNNILVVIINYAKFMKDDFGPTHPLYEDVDEIAKAARRGADLVRQLLAFSRKEIVQPDVIDLNEVIVGTERLLKRLVGEEVELNFGYAIDAWPTKADRGQLEQILMNFAVNARDAMSEGGKLTINTSNVIVDEELASLNPGLQPGSYVCLSVADTGVGIAQEVVPHIFEPFFTTKERGKGTGLGLSTVYGIVKQSDGYIAVDSELGRGTTFRVYLPATEERVGTEVRVEVPEVVHLEGRETVLIVEDEDGVRALMMRILERAGYRVLEASGAEEAMTRVRDEDIDLLLTDVIMSGRSGKWLSDELAAAGRRFHTLYVSGYAFETIAERGVLLEGVRLLNKPFTEDQLLAAVREALDTDLAEVPTGHKGVRVLLIDDDPAFREMMSLLLKDRDEIAEIRASGHSAETIQICRDLAADVVLMDHVGPGEGRDLLQQIRATAPDAGIVSLSGTPGPREGTDAHVLKSAHVLEDVMKAIGEVTT